MRARGGIPDGRLIGRGRFSPSASRGGSRGVCDTAQPGVRREADGRTGVKGGLHACESPRVPVAVQQVWQQLQHVGLAIERSSERASCAQASSGGGQPKVLLENPANIHQGQRGEGGCRS